MAGGIPQNLLANLSVRLGMDTKAFDLGTKQANKNLLGFKSMLGGVKALFGAAFGAMAIRQLFTFANSAIEAFKISNAAAVKLQTIMRQRMNASDKMIQSVKDLASEQQKLGVVEDDIQISGAQMLATFLHKVDALKLLIPAMNNLVAQQSGYNATEQDAIKVATMMGKVLDGNVGALKRVGVSFTTAQQKMLKSGDEMQRAATLAQVITDNVGEMNKELAKTDLGKIKQLENLMGDLKEDIGEAVLPIKVDLFSDFYDDLVIWKSNEITFWNKVATLFDKSGERTQKALDKIAEKSKIYDQWVNENTDLVALQNLFMTDQEKIIADLAKVGMDKTETDKKTNVVLIKQIPLLENINAQIKEKQDLFDASLNEAELKHWGEELQYLKDKKKYLESLGSLEYFKKLEEKQGLKSMKGITAQVTPTTPETIPGITPAGLEPSHLDFSWWEVAADDLERINDEISQSFADLAVDMTDAFFEMAASGEGFQPGNLLLPIANVAENLGKLAISTGITTIMIKKSLTALQGIGAIAAGIALVALAKMVKAKAAAMAGGGSVSPNLPTFQQGSNTDRESTRYYGEPIKQELHVTFEDAKITGEIIRLGVKRAELKHTMQS